MTILIDADGCPVVNLTLQVAKRFSVPVTILCDTSHQIEREGAQTLVFDKGADSVDFALVNRVKPGDIVVTQDYGLASMCLAKCARVCGRDWEHHPSQLRFRAVPEAVGEKRSASYPLPRSAPQLRQPSSGKRRSHEADSGMVGSQRLLHHRQYLRPPRLRFQALVCTGDAGGAGLWQCVSMMPYAPRQGGRAMFRQKRMDRRIKFICPFDLAEHQGVEPWHRSPGLSHFECDLLRPLE